MTDLADLTGPLTAPAPPVTPTRPMLAVRNLSAGYGRIKALDDVSIDVGAGQVVALLGANGAGKTTLLRAISGLIRPWAGSVVVDGTDVTGASPDVVAGHQVAHVPEGRGLFVDMTVEENLAMGCEGLDAAATSAAIATAVTSFPILGERRAQRAGTLSGGQQQMLTIARALCKTPRLLMLDEMSQGLAPLVVADLFERIPRIRAAGTSILLVEQYAAAALGVADVAYVMDKGRITYAGSPAALAADDEAIRDAYLGGQGTERVRSSGPPAALEEVVIRIPPGLQREYEALARRRGTTIGDQVRASLQAWLNLDAAPPPAPDPPAPKPRRRTPLTSAHRRAPLGG